MLSLIKTSFIIYFPSFLIGCTSASRFLIGCTRAYIFSFRSKIFNFGSSWIFDVPALCVIVVDVLREALIRQISEINETESEDQRIKKFNEMLDKSFPVIRNKKLQPVAMHIMKFIPQIKPDYLAEVTVHSHFLLVNIALLCYFTVFNLLVLGLIIIIYT